MADSEDASRSSSQSKHPSLIGGHANYIQGAISSTLGYASGEEQKNRAVNEIRDANNHSRRSSMASGTSSEPPVKSNLLGTVEKKLGELAGCEGLIEDGEARMTTNRSVGSEEQSGTG